MLSKEFSPENVFSKQKMWSSGLALNAAEPEFMLFTFNEPTELRKLSFDNPTLIGSNKFGKITTISIEAGPSADKLTPQLTNEKFMQLKQISLEPSVKATVAKISFNSSEAGFLVKK